MWLRALLVGGLFAGLLSACALVDPVDSRYDTVTRSLAKARDEAIFLNLVRASHHYPLAFTTIANVTPTMTNTSSFALPQFSIGPPNCIIASLVPPFTRTCSYPTGALGHSVGVSNSTASNSTAVSTNFNVSTEETGSFYEGFLKPIDLTILDYFIRQGYSRELLFWLFTDRFELTTPKGSLGFHYNPPQDLGCDPNDPKHRCFIDWVHNAALSGLTVEEQSQEKGSSGGGKGGGGGGSSSSGPSSKPTTYTYARFCFNPVLAEEAAALAPRPMILQSQNDLDVGKAQLYGADLRCGSPAWKPQTTADQPQPDILPLKFSNGAIQFRIVPRSAYGVFEFLGALMRLQSEGYQPETYPPVQAGRYPANRPWVGQMPPELATVENNALITVARNYDGECFVHTWFKDGDYCVPEHATTTKEVFGLLSQLIAIQTAAADLSITPIVRVIQ
jgi:hypothetical protein